MVGNENTKTKRQKTWRNLPIHTKYKHQYEHRHLIKTILTDNAPISDYKRRWMELLWPPKSTKCSLSKCARKNKMAAWRSKQRRSHHTGQNEHHLVAAERTESPFLFSSEHSLLFSCQLLSQCHSDTALPHPKSCFTSHPSKYSANALHPFTTTTSVWTPFGIFLYASWHHYPFKIMASMRWVFDPYDSSHVSSTFQFCTFLSNKWI